jgi:hypothetical protein
LGIISFFKGFFGLKTLRKVLSTILGHFYSSMPIKDPKEEDFFADAVEKYCIFHVFPPT